MIMILSRPLSEGEPSFYGTPPNNNIVEYSCTLSLICKGYRVQRRIIQVFFWRLFLWYDPAKFAPCIFFFFGFTQAAIHRPPT